MADQPNMTVQQWLDKVNAANHSVSALTGTLIGAIPLGSPIPDGFQAVTDKMEEAVQALKDANEAQSKAASGGDKQAADEKKNGHNEHGKAKKK